MEIRVEFNRDIIAGALAEILEQTDCASDDAKALRKYIDDGSETISSAWDIGVIIKAAGNAIELY